MLAYLFAVGSLVAGLILCIYGCLGPGLLSGYGALCVGLGLLSLAAAYVLLAASL